ncbi:MAG: MFS transporter [Synergistaceae bacterium]|nr:MFS transporter [Synergistaceae bacterium]
MQPESSSVKQSHAGSAILPALAASLIYSISSGLRANYGVLLGPISQSSGVDYASVSFVLAIAQLVFGVAQPLFGLLAIKKSNAFVLRGGVVLMAAGLLSLPLCKSMWSLMLMLGLALSSGTAALSFGIVMGIITPQIPRRVVPTVSGIVTASSGAGSTVLSPLIQILCAAAGLTGAALFLGIPSLLLLPVSVLLCRPAARAAAGSAPKEAVSIPGLLREAEKSKDYRFLLAGFFTCGFHMAIIETHLFTQITGCGFSEQIAAYAFSVYGISTMVGSVISGALCGRFYMKNVLGALYASRVGLVLLFLALPKSLAVIYGFAVLLGLTGAATVPPTSGLTERLFGAAKLAMLFGVVFFSHQIGSFFSAWLGGICLSVTGGYTIIWLADAVFSAIAAVVSFLIKEKG